MNKLELTGVKYILARFKSKSPNGYQLLTNIAGSLAGICALYILAYNTGSLGGLFPSYVAVLGKLNSLAIVAGAALTSVGLTSMSTTTDPELISKELSANIAATVQGVEDLKKK